MTRRTCRLLVATLLGVSHVAGFLFLLGARLSIGNAPKQSLAEALLAFPFVSLVNYLPGPDLFAIAVILNGALWGWGVSLALETLFFRGP
jgi:hypothetical protein